MQTPDPTEFDTDEREEYAEIQKEGGADAPAPTISGGQIGQNMTGGGQLQDPEVTDDKQGNPSSPEMVLHIDEDTTK